VPWDFRRLPARPVGAQEDIGGTAQQPARSPHFDDEQAPCVSQVRLMEGQAVGAQSIRDQFAITVR
jgi:hypothetical protein